MSQIVWLTAREKISALLSNLLLKSTGNVIRADVLVGSDGRSKGQGTVVFETKYEAQQAIARFDGYAIGDRTLVVREDRFV